MGLWQYSTRTTPCGPDTALSSSCSSLVDQSYDFDFKCNYITADDVSSVHVPTQQFTHCKPGCILIKYFIQDNNYILY